MKILKQSSYNISTILLKFCVVFLKLFGSPTFGRCLQLAAASIRRRLQLAAVYNSPLFTICRILQFVAVYNSPSFTIRRRSRFTAAYDSPLCTICHRLQFDVVYNLSWFTFRRSYLAWLNQSSIRRCL